MEPYIINQTGDQLQSILNKAIIKAELQTTEDGNQAIRFTASDGTSISVTLPEWSKRIEYLLQNTYYLQEGIGCAAFDYAMSLGDVTIQSGEVTRQDGDSIILDTSANRFVLERSGKFYTKFLSNGASLQGADVYASRRHTFLNRQDKSYWYRKEDGTFAQGSSTFVIGNWLKTLQSECDSTQETAETARTAAQKAQKTATEAKAAAAALLQEIPWEGRHMNMFTETGEYHIHGESTDANDGMPILNSGTIDARLTVLDSSLTNGTGAKTDTVVTQILRLSNRTGGDGHVYVRTAQAASKAELTATDNTKWGTWEKLMGIFEKNAVTNIADLDTYTTNGMYSGLFADTTLQSLGGLQFTPGDTFLLITVNGYASSAFGTPQLTQMLYRLPSKKGSGNNSARMYMRTAYWKKDAEPKKWEFANWDRLAMASEISGGGGGSIEEYNRLIELITANTEKISSVESTANAAKSAAETAQTTATAAQTKNTEQDLRLNNIEELIVGSTDKLPHSTFDGFTDEPITNFTKFTTPKDTYTYKILYSTTKKENGFPHGFGLYVTDSNTGFVGFYNNWVQIGDIPSMDDFSSPGLFKLVDENGVRYYDYVVNEESVVIGLKETNALVLLIPAIINASNAFLEIYDAIGTNYQNIEALQTKVSELEARIAALEAK